MCASLSHNGNIVPDNIVKLCCWFFFRIVRLARCWIINSNAARLCGTTLIMNNLAVADLTLERYHQYEYTFMRIESYWYKNYKIISKSIKNEKIYWWLTFQKSGSKTVVNYYDRFLYCLENNGEHLLQWIKFNFIFWGFLRMCWLIKLTKDLFFFRYLISCSEHYK